MSRTMSQEENKELKNIIEKKRQELTGKKAIINYLTKAGFCNKKGVAIYPYNSIRDNE